MPHEPRIASQIARAGRPLGLPLFPDDPVMPTFDNYYARVGDAVVHVVNLQETPEASVAVLTAAAGKL